MLNTIAEAIEDIKNGKVVIVVDDQERENEGDFITAAENITDELVNFMTSVGNGLLCVPLTADRCNNLNLDMMVGRNTVLHQTQFTVSVDLIGGGCTTGISTSDRAKTIQALAHVKTKPQDLGRPGHIFPLRAIDGGVLRRPGHTEAAVDLARLAGFQPAGTLIEILKKDGSIARFDDLVKISKQHQMKIISIEDLISYRMKHDTLINSVDSFDVNTRFGQYTFHVFQQTNNSRFHYALTKGLWDSEEEILVRVHSLKAKNDLIAFLTSNTKEQLKPVFDFIEKDKKGVVVFIDQEDSEINVLNRISKFKENQHKGIYGNPRIEMDELDYGIGAQIIHTLGVRKLKLITRRPIKRIGIEGYGLKVVDNITF